MKLPNKKETPINKNENDNLITKFQNQSTANQVIEKQNEILKQTKNNQGNLDDEEKEIKSKKKLNLDELLATLNTDSLIQYCLENPSLKHFNFLKYMIPDNYLPLKIDIPLLGSKLITRRGGGGFSGAVNTTLEIIKEVLKEKNEKKTQKKGEN